MEILWKPSQGMSCFLNALITDAGTAWYLELYADDLPVFVFGS